MCHSLGKRCVNAFINLFWHWMIYSMSLDIGWCKGSSHIQSSSSISPFLSPCLVFSRPTSHVLSDPCSCHFHSIPISSCLSSSLVLIFISCLFSPYLHRVPPLVYSLRFSSSFPLPLLLCLSSSHLYPCLSISPVTSYHCWSPCLSCPVNCLGFSSLLLLSPCLLLFPSCSVSHLPCPLLPNVSPLWSAGHMLMEILCCLISLSLSIVLSAPDQ